LFIAVDDVPGVTKQMVYEKYIASCPDGYKSSAQRDRGLMVARFAFQVLQTVAVCYTFVR
jgi:hypothetical protein